MIVATTCFGEMETDWHLVDEWAIRVNRAVPDAYVVMITDQDPAIYKIDLLVIDERSLMERDNVESDRAVTDYQGMNFDKKGAMLCQALKILGGDLLYLDLDAHLMKDPRPVLSKLRGPMFMADNRFDERVIDGKGTTMGCAGVMWFPTFGQRKIVTESYMKAFTDRSKSTDPLLEQYCWSIAAGNAERLPLSFNADPDNCEDAYVVHYCGKKDRI